MVKLFKNFKSKSKDIIIPNSKEIDETFDYIWDKINEAKDLEEYGEYIEITKSLTSSNGISMWFKLTMNFLASFEYKVTENIIQTDLLDGIPYTWTKDSYGTEYLYTIKVDFQKYNTFKHIIEAKKMNIL